MLLLSKDRFNDTFGSPRVHHDMIGATVLWILWLVGAAITTVSVFSFLYLLFQTLKESHPSWTQLLFHP